MTSAMTALEPILQKIWDAQSLIQAVFSTPVSKDRAKLSRADIRPVDSRGGRRYQVSEQIGSQVFHKNLTSAECHQLILMTYLTTFQQLVLFTTNEDFHVTLRAGEAKIRTKVATKSAAQQPTHNRIKNYAVDENVPVPYLIALGIMNGQGKVFPPKMAKFKQINRFLETVADTLEHLPTDKILRVVDCGCGKAYLTFALYDYLTRLCSRNVHLVGLDLKESVLAECQQLAQTLKFDGLHFQYGEIANYQAPDSIDMVVALHACDTATDAALAMAVHSKAKVILAAPCCQHELFNQLKSVSLDGLLQYGLLKERFAALTTDAARACLLEAAGYQTQMLEFIDSEHTPKNLLIRAVHGNSTHQREQGAARFAALKASLAIHPTLERLLSSRQMAK